MWTILHNDLEKDMIQVCRFIINSSYINLYNYVESRVYDVETRPQNLTITKHVFDSSQLLMAP